MSPAIISAFIGLAGSAFGALIGILVSSKLTQYRLEQLENKMDAFATAQKTLEERVYHLEEHNVVQDERVKSVNRRLDNLEQARGNDL